jgi:two-component system, chemotaxis family, CheB/CheR fusion protein
MDVSEDGNGRPFLIVTGSSAGGIDALNAVVGGLPDGLNAAVVVAQHLDPMHESRLADILAVRSPLPVRIADANQPLETGVIYVVPPNRDVEITDGHAVLKPAERSGPKPSIDQLFKSAAVAYGDRLVAVILSGMGSDGVAGARVVKEHGGTVIIQNPETAGHPSMPLAIPPTIVDLVVNPQAIGSTLTDLLRGSAPPDQQNEQRVLRSLLAQLRERSGIDFLQYKTPTIMRRLARLMVATGVDSVADYMRYLQAHPEGYQRLANAFLIKVTEFFRDATLFSELRENIFPRLIADARARSAELRIWSAGSSTGEEAYSLAILCAETMRDDAERVPVRIFATDLAEDAVAFARRGSYGRDALRHVPPAWIDRYFVRNGEAFEVSKLVRNMTVFGQHDLGQRAPFPRIDLCMCRNVLIYFTRELQLRALQLFAFSLRENGYLVLGKAETTNPLPSFFRATNPALKIYQRYGDRVLIPPTRMRETASDLRGPARASVGVLQTVVAQRLDLRANPTELLGATLANSRIGCVVVDRRYDILAINATARELVGIHGVGIGEDLIHLAKSFDSNKLRAMIDAAFHSEHLETVTLEAKPPINDDGGRWVTITCVAESQNGAVRGDTVGVLLTDVTEAVTAKLELEAKRSARSAEFDAATARVAEMQQRHKTLVAANEELTQANLALRNANEQLLIGTEEAASASEEIETLNEEMQATNEELETLNEELQATVEELNTTNDELEARGAELEETIAERDGILQRLRSERRSVNAAVETTAGPFAILDESGAALFASPAVEQFVTLKKDEAWRNGVTVEISGAQYKIERTDISSDDGAAVFLVFRREPAKG